MTSNIDLLVGFIGCSQPPGGNRGPRLEAKFRDVAGCGNCLQCGEFHERIRAGITLDGLNPSSSHIFRVPPHVCWPAPPTGTARTALNLATTICSISTAASRSSASRRPVRDRRCGLSRNRETPSDPLAPGKSRSQVGLSMRSSQQCEMVLGRVSERIAESSLFGAFTAQNAPRPTPNRAP